MQERKILQIIPAVQTFEGAGFLVHRPFPVPGLSFVDPFLLLDEMGPMNLEPGAAKGAPDHPHRGFETVTYLLEGEFEHRDSAGNSGKLFAGDVQWMTAGAGVVHSEMPSENFMKTGGRMHGFQIWVNLPAEIKMSKPRYQEIKSSSIPLYKSEDGKTQIKVIAGRIENTHAKIETHTPIVYYHVTMQAGGKFSIPVDDSLNVMAYVISGSAKFADSKETDRAHLVIFQDTGHVSAATEKGVSFLLLGGRPLQEPVARYGPFVMNTADEIYQAFDDYRSGRMGEIGGAA